MIMSQSKASMNYFDFAMSNSTNTVEIDAKDGNLYLHLRAMLYTIYAVLSSHCQIRADDNSSTCAFTADKSY